jgi:hypothetical protein
MGTSFARDILITYSLLPMMDRPNHKPTHWLRLRLSLVRCLLASALLGVTTAVADALPNGTWFSKPQIMFHLSNGTLGPVMERVRAQRYRVVFLDFRNVSDLDQQKVAQAARDYQLVPVAWIQSPEYRSLSVQQFVEEGQYTDGIQIDDHYSRSDFYKLRSQYKKSIYCSIQPFQAALVPLAGCNQVDVQCYSPVTLKQCVGLADRLKAVTSLSAQNTLGFSEAIGGRSFNVFLWPHSDEFAGREPAQKVEAASWNNGL